MDSGKRNGVRSFSLDDIGPSLALAASRILQKSTETFYISLPKMYKNARSRFITIKLNSPLVDDAKRKETWTDTARKDFERTGALAVCGFGPWEKEWLPLLELEDIGPNSLKTP